MQLKYFLNALLHLKEDIKCLDIKSRIKDFSDYQGFFLTWKENNENCKVRCLQHFVWKFQGIENIRVFRSISYRLEHIMYKICSAKWSYALVHRDGCTTSHGPLYRWTENSFPFFLFLKPVEISKKCFNIIWTYLKVV